MKIKAVDIHSAAYQNLLRQCGQVFNLTEWLSLYDKRLKTLGVYNGEELMAVFNAFNYKKTLLTFFITPPFTPDSALLISKTSDEKAVLEYITEWLQQETTKKNYSLLELAFSYQYTSFLTAIPSDFFKKKKRHTYVLNIAETERPETLYAPKRRQQIRRAERDGLQAIAVTDMNIVFDLVKKTFDRQKKKIDLSFIKKILFEFTSSANSFAFASTKDGKYYVVYFCVYYNNYAYYLMGGYDEGLKHIGAGPLAMNACINTAKKLGIHTFDFEGSMEPSIEKYFKEFGGEKKQYFMLEKKNTAAELRDKIKRVLRR